MIVGRRARCRELAARHLRRSGASHIFVTNRTHERAVEMAELFQGTPVEYTRFIGMLPEVDILIASSGAPHYILHKDEMQRVIAARRNKPMFLIDIAVPRNIEPAVNELDNVFLYDIDDLQEVVNANLRERMKEAEHAEADRRRRGGAHDGAAQGGRGDAHHRRPAGAARTDPRGRNGKGARASSGRSRRSRRRPSRRSPAASSTRSRTGRSPNCATTPASRTART